MIHCFELMGINETKLCRSRFLLVELRKKWQRKTWMKRGIQMVWFGEGDGVCLKRKLVRPTFQELTRSSRLANNRIFERE